MMRLQLFAAVATGLVTHVASQTKVLLFSGESKDSTYSNQYK